MLELLPGEPCRFDTGATGEVSCDAGRGHGHLCCAYEEGYSRQKDESSEHGMKRVGVRFLVGSLNFEAAAFAGYHPSSSFIPTKSPRLHGSRSLLFRHGCGILTLLLNR